MTVVRLAAGGSLVWSAIALVEPEMVKLEAFGTPCFLIVPNPGHRLDARLYGERPEVKVITLKGAVEAASEAVSVDATTNVIGDPEVEFLTIAGTADAESALVIRRSSRTTLIANDIVGHITHLHGLGVNHGAPVQLRRA